MRHSTQEENDDYEAMLERKSMVLVSEKFEHLKAENAKLRLLVRHWYPHMLRRVGRDALKQWGQMDVVKELGIEVEE